ncbi:putative acylesterase/phospholipase RssA [Bradyrhizobium sp. LA6.1]|uniref:patatin-like phospholipase family protein n=1 Tax=Bradyrhizobium sp. LA6.1 TaxID=3156378 RepID=UPI0033934918
MEGPAKLSPPQSIVLCLSGGGLRATFFHLGVIRTLKRLNLLDKVTDIVSVSGGSIIAAHLVQHWAKYVGAPKFFDKAQLGLLSLRQWDLRGRAIRRSLLWWPLYALALRFPKYLWRWRVGRTELLRREYDEFYGRQTLDGLSKLNGPEFHIVSTNLKTGGLCFFTKDKYRVFEEAKLKPYHAELTKLSLVVVASSAFPPVFPPILFDESFTSADPGSFRVSPHVLTDGGVYDNTGFESAALLDTERQENKLKLSDLILVSDAGSPFQWRQFGEFTNPFALALRASQITMNRVAEATLRRIASDDRVGLISIDDIDERDGLKPRIQKSVSLIRTDLDRFSDIEVAALVRHGENKAARHLMQRFEISPNACAVNEFPLSLPSSNEALAEALQTSWKVRWWNTFTNFSDFFPTLIIDSVGLAALSGALFSTYLIVGTIYLQLVTPLRTPIVESEAVAQSDPVLKPLPVRPIKPAPEINATTVPYAARANLCLDRIDTTDATLSVDQVRSLARQCLQTR